jgi:hypothetical protein
MNRSPADTRNFTVGAGLLANALGKTLQQWASRWGSSDCGPQQAGCYRSIDCPGSVDFAV